MSEGKKVLVVVEELDRVILQEQFIAMGIDVEIVVDRDKAGSIATGLMSLPTMRDEMMRILGQREYGSDFRRDSGALTDRVAKEFNEFCLHYNFQALRDSTIGKLNYAFSQGPDSGNNPVLQDSQREASVSINAFDEAQDLMRKTLVEMLHELKGIKAAVTPAPHPGPEPEKSAFCLQDWLEFAMKNPVEVKEHLTKFGPVSNECRSVTSKEEAIAELVKVLTGEQQFFPSILMFSLPFKDREEIVKLLKPAVSMSFHGHYNQNYTVNLDPVDTGIFFNGLLKALDDGSDIINIYGLNTLRKGDRNALRLELQRALGQGRIKVAGHSKEAFVDGLSRALTQAVPPNTDILIQGIDDLSKEDTRYLINALAGEPQENAVLARGGQLTARGIIETLVEALGSSEIGTVKLHDLSAMDSGVKRSLQSALKWTLGRYDQIEKDRKELLVNGTRSIPVKVPNVSLILQRLAIQLHDQALEDGIEVNEMSLLSYLLNEAVTKRPNNDSPHEESTRIFKEDLPTTVHVKNGVGVTVELGNQRFTRNEDGSLKIIIKTVGGDNVSTFVLATDGSLKFDNLGYMG